MLILAIDSSGAACAVCVWRDGEILAASRETMQRGQDARLMPMIIEVVAQAATDFPAFDRIAVTRGPGSFTGLRVGLAAARGIGLASGKPVFGIDRFAICRVLHDAPQGLLAVVDSKRAELFCRYFPADGAPQEPVLMTQAQIDAFLAAHPNVTAAGDFATPGDDIAAAGALLASRAREGDPDTAASPLYLRAPDVTFPVAGAISR